MHYCTYNLLNTLTDNLNNIYSLGHQISSHPANPLSYTWLGKTISASFETAYRSTKKYSKRAFSFESTIIENLPVSVEEKIVLSKPFCQLRHFKRATPLQQPKLLIVAALSGHHATLLKDTVKALLPNHDIYITDWCDARNVPLSEGRFGFDEYIQYLIEFIEHIGMNTHVLAVCQPTVQSLMATAIMAARKHPCTPKTLTLMAGPIDTRINPTVVNKFAKKYSLDWFKRTAITTVPYGNSGAGRKVYPGFLQLGSFMAMNLDSHVKKHYQFFKNLVLDQHEAAQAHRDFYDEYMAVLDMTAEFYLETLERVFINHHIPDNKATFFNDTVDFSAINNTALLTIEAGRDDVCGLGQTQAAHSLCSNIPCQNKLHYVQKDVGHYGIFSGSKYRELIAPRIKEFILNNNQT